MSEPVETYPLAWPPGWRRTEAAKRTSAKFQTGTGAETKRLDLAAGARRVYRELRLMGVFEETIVVSSNLRTRLDGLPYSKQPVSELDPGIAVYWQAGKTRRCMAIDRYDRIADNLGAVAATLEAMRAIERHGGAEILDRAFTGFVALPAPEQWFTVLGVSVHASRSEIEEAYRRLAMKHHPDRSAGSAAEMARINVARDEGLEALP